MKSVVTGGAGFIGAHLVRALHERGDEVVVVDNLRRGVREAVPPAVALVHGDVRDLHALEWAFRGAERVFHLAAQSNVMGAMSDTDYSFQANVVGTYNVLKCAAAAGAKKLVFTSSREVYGEPVSFPVREDAALLAKNPYGASKVAGEAYCRTWGTLSPMEISVVRLGNVYGPGDHGRVIPLWLDLAWRSQPIEVFGGEQVLDFVPVGMCVAALLTASERRVEGPVNVVTGVGTPLLKLAERVKQLAGRQLEVRVLPARGAEVVKFVGDATRMRTLLGIQPPADPLEGLEGMWRAMATRP